ncbi:MAG: hypothetical protein AB7I27_02715 [Bacteriovoracaceae bacterium]
MKKTILNLTVLASLSTSFFSQNAMSDAGAALALGSVSATSLALPLGSCRAGDNAPCTLAMLISTGELTYTLAALKQIQAVQADSLNYAATGEMSVELESVINDLKARAIEQGLVVTTEDLIDGINNLR